MINQVFRQQALDKLNSPDDLNELLTVTSPRGWLMFLAAALLLVAAIVWSLVATIETTVSGSGMLVPRSTNEQALEGVLYVSIADSRRIQPGMSARLAPAAVRTEEFGMLWATVASVQALPSTQSEMVQVLGNDALVQALASAGAIVEVRLDLQPNVRTPSGYAWTSAAGPPMQLWSGPFSEGYVVTSRQRPIDLMLVR